MSLATFAGSTVDTIKGFLGGERYDQENRAAMSDDGQIISELEDLFKSAKEDRRKYEEEWQTNIAFLRGDQWLEWNKSRQTLYLPPAPPWRVRLVTNLVQPIYRTILGKITSQATGAKVVSANGTTESKQDARAQDELLDYLKTRCDSDAEYLEALKWAVVAGTGLHHPCWDKSLGDEVMEPDTIMAEGVDQMTGAPTQVEQPNPNAGQPVREPGPDGQPDQQGNAVHMGDIDHIAVSPFEFYPEPLAKKTEDMEWAFFVKVRPSSYIQRKFGVKLEPEAITTDDYQLLPTEDTQPQTTKGNVVKEFWRRPTSEHPKGQYVVYSGTAVLYQGDNPYPKEPMPFFEVRESIIPGRFWGRSVVSDLVPLQRNYNKTHSQAVEIRNSTAKPKWTVARNALRPGETITTAPAEVILYDPQPGSPDGGRPMKVEGGDIPDGFFKIMEHTQQEFYEVAGLHDFKRGLQGLAGGKTLGGLSLLIEQDDTRIGLLKKEYDASIVKAERAKLRLAKQFYIEPRTLTVVGPDFTAESREFYADRIPDDVEVRVIASGNLPTSAAARQDYILNLRKEGFFKDDRIPAKLLGLSDIEGIDEELNRDRRQVERENQQLKTGKPVQAHDYDNHMIHGEEHDAFRKGEEYENIALKNPAAVQAFVAHMEMHKQLVVAATPQAPLPMPGGSNGPVPSPVGG